METNYVSTDRPMCKSKSTQSNETENNRLIPLKRAANLELQLWL